MCQGLGLFVVNAKALIIVIVSAVVAPAKALMQEFSAPRTPLAMARVRWRFAILALYRYCSV